MKRLSPDKIKKLATVQMIAEVNNNWDILRVLPNLVYLPNSKGIAFTDGKLVYITDKLFELSPDEIYFVINHEFDHIYYRHFNRFASNMKLENYIVNVATDLIINELLTLEGLKQPEGTITRAEVSKNIGKPVRGRTSEEVFEEIKEFYKKDQEDQNKKQNGSGESSEGSGEGSEGESGESSKGESGESSEGSKGSSSENIEDALDKLLGKGKGGAYKENIDEEKAAIEQARSRELSEEEKEAIAEAINKINERVVTKAATNADARSRLETDRNFKPKKVDWKSVLKQFLGRHLKRAEIRNPMRPTTRYDDIFGSSRVLIPSTKGYTLTPKINVYLDISGSMSSLISSVRTELNHAERYFKKYKGSYYEFNTEIIEFKNRNDFYSSSNVDGGTNITKVLTHYIQDKSADLGILITDAQDEFSEALDLIKKSTLIITNNVKLKTNNRKVTIVVTDFN